MLLALVAAVPVARATMPPVSCGSITVAGKRYLVKADQIGCATAKRWAHRYLTARRRPAGWRCTVPPKTSRIKVFCRRSYRTFFAQR